jgi:hypothetical protein
MAAARIRACRTLEELGLRPGDNVLDTRCPDLGAAPANDASSAQAPALEEGRGYTDLALQFSKATNRTARGGIIRIGYKSGNEVLTHRIGFGLVLCEGDSDNQKIPSCEYDDYGWK